MPIQGDIALGLQPQNPMGGVQALAMGQQMADNASLEQERQQRIKHEQQAAQQQQLIQQTLHDSIDPQTGTVNVDTAVKKLQAQGFYQVADALQKQADSSLKSMRDSAKVELENHDLVLNQLSKQGRAVRDSGSQGAYQDFVTQVAKAYGPGVASGMPTSVQAAAQPGGWFDHAETWADSQKESIDRINGLNSALEKAPTTAKGWFDLASQQLSVPNMPPSEAQATLGVLEAHGLPKDIAQQFVGKTPEQVGQMGITPEQRAQQAQAAANEAGTTARAKTTAEFEAERIALQRKALDLKAGTTADPEDVAAWVRQLRDTSSGAQIGQIPSNIRTAVMRQLQPGEIVKLTAQNQAVKEFAGTVVSHIQPLEDMATQIDQLGLMGTAGGVFRKMAANQSFAADLANLTPPQRELVGKFATEAGLFVSATARAHGGARGGASPQMIEYLKTLLDPSGKDLSTYKGNLSGARDYLQGYADMGASKPPTGGGASTTSQAYTGERRQAADGRILGKVGDKVVELTQKSDGSWVVK